MLCDQQHRGPDGAGVASWTAKTGWRSGYAPTPGRLPDFSEARARCVLGHNWLAIQDTSSAARQPMFLGDLGLTFNGEIYNFVELREQLVARGVALKTLSDTEVLLHLWRIEGPDCLDLLRGMFAFGIYDSGRDVLWAARDPFGIKPLYYARACGGVVLSSEIRALHGIGLVARRFRETAVIASAAAGVNKFGTSETLYEDVFEVPPGHFVRICGDDVQLKPYHRLPDLSGDADGSAAIRILRETTEESVRLHLRSRRQVATCLSGGLDSSNLAWCIGEQLGSASKEFTAFTICTAAREDSEIHLAAELAQQAGLRHEIVDHQGTIEVSDVLEMTVAYEIPNHVIGPINQFLLLRQIRDSGAVVVLDGQGGDELLSGYPWYGSVLVESVRQRGGDAVVLEENRRKHLPMTLEICQIFERIFADPSAWLQGFMGGPDFLGIPAAVVSELNETRYYLNGGEDWRTLRLREYYQGDLPLLLRQEDRLGMWFGLECRVPLVDPVVVEMASHLAPELLLRDGYLKYPFRCMIPELPESIRWNTRKRGFWETTPTRFPGLMEVGRTLAMESPLLRRTFPKMETGWDALNFEQKWRLLQCAVLERCATRQQAVDLGREVNSCQR